MTAFVTLAEIERALLHDKPRRRIIIPDVLPAGPSLIYGPSGVGKTGIAIRTAVAVAGGLQWADRIISRGSVLYVAGEDIEGAKIRLVAAARELGLDPSSLPVAIMEAPPAGLVDNGARIAILAAAKSMSKNFDLPVAAVVVDTLAASFGPKSQDDASAASDYMSNADRTARELECAFLSIHHTGKNENSGMRGSRVFFDRADAVVKVNKGKGGVTFVEVEKMRNGPSGARFAFDIAGADVETAGGTISVQVIRQLRALEPASVSGGEAKSQRKQSIADQMLGALIRVIDGKNGATIHEWQSACYDLWPEKKPSTKRQLFSENRKRLLDSGLISIDGETVSASVSRFSTDASLTAKPETVSASVSSTVSIDTGLTDALTGIPHEQDGANVEGRGSVHDVGVGRSKDLPRGCGTGGPASTAARTDTGAGTGTNG